MNLVATGMNTFFRDQTGQCHRLTTVCRLVVNQIVFYVHKENVRSCPTKRMTGLNNFSKCCPTP